MKQIRIVGLLLIASLGIIGYNSHQLRAATPIPQSQENITIVFDLGGVLFESNKRAMFWQLGPRTIFSYLLRNRSTKRMLEQFYDTLNRIDHTQGNPDCAKDQYGNELPHLIAEWLKGDQPNAQIINKIEHAIECHPEWFAANQDQQLIISIINQVFKAENFVQSWHPIPKMVQLVQQCKQKGYQLSILSNWDAESFELLAKKYPDLFALFDKIIISGRVHILKPDPAMFARITENTPANSCIFIDDQAENIAAAQHAGIHGILATPKRALFGRTPDVQKIKSELIRLEALCSQECT